MNERGSHAEPWRERNGTVAQQDSRLSVSLTDSRWFAQQRDKQVMMEVSLEVQTSLPASDDHELQAT